MEDGWNQTTYWWTNLNFCTNMMVSWELLYDPTVWWPCKENLNHQKMPWLHSVSRWRNQHCDTSKGWYKRGDKQFDFKLICWFLNPRGPANNLTSFFVYDKGNYTVVSLKKYSGNWKKLEDVSYEMFSIIRNFISFVGKKVCRLKKADGGIRSIMRMKEAYLGKWLWKN